MGGCDRSGFLTGRHAAAKEGLHLNENLGDDALKLSIVRRDFERRIHQHAALALQVAQGSLDDLIEEGANGFARGEMPLEAPDAIAETMFDVVIQRTLIERTFVAEGVIQTGAVNPHFPL